MDNAGMVDRCGNQPVGNRRHHIAMARRFRLADVDLKLRFFLETVQIANQSFNVFRPSGGQNDHAELVA